jgi:acid stress-induced BolA-like protein IbaG/YrbA
MTTVVSRYGELAEKVRQVVRGTLGENATVDTEERQDGRVFVVAVSPVLNGKTQRQRQDFVWKPVRKALGKDAQLVFIMTYGTDELM